MGKMDGMVTIVTGASRGLGRAIAKEYGREGAKVVVCARPQSPTGLSGTIQTTAQDIEAEGGEAFAVPCDVTDEGQIRDMVKRVMDRYGQIDVLVNNAGLMIPSEPFLDIGPDRWDQCFLVNVRGPYITCRNVVPVMMEQRRGSIVSIGSRAGAVPRNGGTSYCTTKGAFHFMTLCLAEELREYNVAANILEPGAMRSEGSSIIPYAQRDWHERIEPEEVGPTVVYLALQDARSMTGQMVTHGEFGKTWGA